MNLHQFAQTLFLWCENQNIPLVLCRPKFSIEEFENTDLDIAVDNRHIDQIIQWLKTNNYKITCRYDRHDGQTVHFYKKLEDSKEFFFHIDFITAFEIRGIAYLGLKEVFNRSYDLNGIHYLDVVDQTIVLIATHILKHRDQQKIQSYSVFLKEAMKEYSFAIQEKLESIFGAAHSADIINAVRGAHGISTSFTFFLTAAWKTQGILALLGILEYFVTEIILRFSMPKYNIIFLGVDGAGKTSLINRLQKELYEAVPVIKHVHLLPALPWQKEKDAFVTQSNPHNKLKRSQFISMIKLFYFLTRYWLIRLCPIRKPVLSLYDRHVYDLAVDPVRFRFNGPKNLWRLLKLFPQSDLCLIVDVSPETAQSRKQEVPFTETKRQVAAYRELKEKLANGYILKNEFPIEKITAIAKEMIVQQLVSKNETRY